MFQGSPSQLGFHLLQTDFCVLPKPLCHWHHSLSAMFMFTIYLFSIPSPKKAFWGVCSQFWWKRYFIPVCNCLILRHSGKQGGYVPSHLPLKEVPKASVSPFYSPESGTEDLCFSRKGEDENSQEKKCHRMYHQRVPPIWHSHEQNKLHIGGSVKNPESQWKTSQSGYGTN